MRYISHYLEYPIYEPAEGGYYYSGNQLIKSERKSKKACKKELLKIWEECERENIALGFHNNNISEWDSIIENTHQYPWIFNKNYNYISKSSRYIGEGESYVIEKRMGSQEHGRQPYC